MNIDTFLPKQKRSEETLKKLSRALLELVEEKYFEHISIAEIAACAGVSVGAFYRRFKSKESALPTIYNSFQSGLREWLATNEREWQQLPLENLVHSLVHKTFSFFGSRAGLVRTLHLNSRLHPEFLFWRDSH